MNSEFNTSVSTLGGEFSPQADEGIVGPLFAFVAETNQMILDEFASRINLLPIGNLYIGSIANKEFNAVAFSIERNSHVGIFSGLDCLLHDLSNLLWTSPNFLQSYSKMRGKGPGKLRSNYMLRKYFLKERIVGNNVIVGRFTNGPFDRLALASETFLLAHVFVLLHEVGHIVRAHLDFLNSEFGFGDKLFMENSTSRKGDAEDKVRMYLEWDADRYAIMRLVDFAFTRREIAGTANSDNESKLSRVLLSISLALHCLDIEAKNRNRSTHLIPRDRAMVALSSTIEYMKKAKLKFDLKEVKDVFVRVSAEIEHLFQSTGLLFENSDRKSEFDSLGSLIDFTKDAIRHLEANLVPFIQGRIVRLGKSPKDFEL